MDKSKNSGISIKSIHLVQCNIGDVKPDVDLQFSLGITDFSRTIISDEKVLLVRASFNLMDKIENPPCRFDCTFVATYTRGPDSEMKWEEFQDHVAIAHLIPYLREFVSNMTTRLPFSVLMIPPMNTSKMLEEYRSSRMQTKATPAP